MAVTARASVLVSGGTGSGKTTTLNALSGAIPAGERIVTIEDAAELSLRQAHVVRLEARPPNLEGRGEVTIRQLVRNALRMRPDRIVVGEVRGAEALDLLQALNTGHDGSLSTVHANSPEDALRRLETLALMADVGLPHAAVREQVASAVDLVVHQERRRDGSRAVTSVAEVVRVAGGAGTRELLGGDGVRAPGEGRLGAAARGRGGVSAGALAFAAGALGLLGLLAARRRRRGARRARRGLRGPLARLVDVVVRVGREGRDPGAAERRRLLLAGAAAGVRRRARRWPARSRGLALGAGGPWLVARLLRARREHYRRAVEREAAALARGAGGRAGGRALAARRAGARPRRACRAPAGHELRRVAAELAAGAPHRATRSRRCGAGSARARLDTVVAACLVQRRAGGDLARLLRECAEAFGDQARLEDEVRSATAQARFTGVVVVLLPRGRRAARRAGEPRASSPGSGGSFLTAWLVGIAVVLQVVAAVAIRRLGRVRW